MSTVGSDIESGSEKVPLSGAKLDAAIRAMDSPGFLAKLTVRIVKLAGHKGLFSPFEDDLDLPGGESASGLAVSIMEKALDGSYTWDHQKFPDFYWFCASRAESILSNWLKKHRRLTAMSPIEEQRADGATELNPVNQATDGQDIYELLCSRDGGRLGDDLVADFALSLEHQHDQAILMAIHDDRKCIKRDYCMGKLGLSEREYDAAIKRIRRAGQKFLPEWCRANNIDLDDRNEVK